MTRLPGDPRALPGGEVATLERDRRGTERSTSDSHERTVTVRDTDGQLVGTAYVANESFGGMGIYLDVADPPSVGCTIGVDTGESVRPGAVRWVLWKPNRGWRIGLSWLDLGAA